MKSKVQEIFRKLTLNECVNNKQDEELLLKYFSKHPEIEIKNGAGFKCFKRVRNQWNQSLAIEDINGDIQTISMGYNEVPNHLQNVISALRNEIEPQIEAFRNTVDYGVDKCCFTGEILTRKNSHIDHYDLDFVEILNKYFLFYDLKIEDIKLTKIGVKYYLLDESLKHSFRIHHSCNTNLRCITAKANLTRKKSK